MAELILIRYGELALKGKNRSYFEERLLKNIRANMKKAGRCRVYRTRGRLFVEIMEGDLEEVISRLKDTFGVSSLSTVVRAQLDMGDIKEKALALMEKVHRPGETFKVETKRANKAFPLKSPEVSREVAAYVLSRLEDLPVDVHSPQKRLHVEIREAEAYVFTEAWRGAGGLPVGVSGKGLLLLSGGIDSPVAAYLALKRGVALEALHFHSFPFTSDRAREKVLDLWALLARYGGDMTLHVAPFTNLQKAIYQHCPSDWGVIVMRRMMMRIAAETALRRGSKALFTGENLGQVASQTMESMAVTEDAAGLPVFRPLLCYDKSEIIHIAKNIGTYPISIRPYEDCCTVFVDPHPVPRPQKDRARAVEENFDFTPLLHECLENMETVSISEKASPGKKGIS